MKISFLGGVFAALISVTTVSHAGTNCEVQPDLNETAITFSAKWLKAIHEGSYTAKQKTFLQAEIEKLELIRSARDLKHARELADKALKRFHNHFTKDQIKALGRNEL